MLKEEGKGQGRSTCIKKGKRSKKKLMCGNEVWG